MKLTDAIKGYLLSRKSSRCNEKTIIWYRQKLSHFCEVLRDEHEITLLNKVTITHLRLFVEYMRETKACENNPHKPTQEENVKDVTVKGYVQVIKSFFTWCVREELLKKNPALNLDNPKVTRYVIKTYTDEQIRTLLNACDRSVMIGFRNYAMILLLLDTGIRVAEMCSLTLDHVYLAAKDHAFIKVMGKGRKEREVGLSTEVAECLWKYIHIHRNPKSIRDQTLFINRFGKPLTGSGAEQLLEKLAERCGITGVRVSPHTFRHTFARMFLENGGDIYKLSLLLGHSSVAVTERYLRDFESRNARKEQFKHSPVAHMDLGKTRGGFSKGKTNILDE